MHRHGYKGRKLHRERDQRIALVKAGVAKLNEMSAVVVEEQIGRAHV